MTNASAFTRDANGVPITGLGLVESKSITYTALTTGAVGATTLYTVTGTIGFRLFGVVSGVDLTGTGTLEVGISGNTAAILAQTTGTALDVGEVWVDNAPATIEALPALQIIGAGQDIIQTIAGSTIDTGTITYYCLWFPISSDGNVVAA